MSLFLVLRCYSVSALLSYKRSSDFFRPSCSVCTRILASSSFQSRSSLSCSSCYCASDVSLLSQSFSFVTRVNIAFVSESSLSRASHFTCTLSLSSAAILSSWTFKSNCVCNYLKLLCTICRFPSSSEFFSSCSDYFAIDYDLISSSYCFSYFL